MKTKQEVDPNFTPSISRPPPELHEIIPEDVARVFNDSLSVANMTKSMGQQVVEGLKKVWAYVHGKVPEHLDENHWLFRIKRWNIVLSTSRTKYIQENMINRRVEKVYKEAVCLKNNPACKNPCPTHDWDVCPGCQEP
jgi:hypothetical protein